MNSADVILDYRTSDYEISRIENLGCRTIASEKIRSLYDAVDGHPDLQFAVIDRKVICHKGISDQKFSEIENLTPQLLKGESALTLPYPNHISLNALVTDELFLHKLSSTDAVLLEHARKSGRTLLSTNQGYTRCSCAYVGKNAFVTEDKNIAEILMKAGYQVFYREHADVVLEGFPYGFIGGALSHITAANEQLLLISGELSKYRYGIELKGFLDHQGIIHECTAKGPLKDRGSVIQIPMII